MGKTYAVVDIETTGHSSKNGDRMMQFAVVFVRDWQIIDRFTTFIHPERSIPLFIQDLTHITDDDVREAQPFTAHAKKIYELLTDCVFVAHNTDFDLPFLQAEFKRVGLPIWRGEKIDTVELAKILYPSALSYKLGDIAQDLGIDLQRAHRADEDAQATAKLFIACYAKLQQLPQPTLEAMHRLSFHAKTDIAQLFFSVLSWKRTQLPSDDFMRHHGLMIKKPVTQTSESITLTYPATDAAKEALLATQWRNFEKRPAQFTMMDEVYKTLQHQQDIVIEASTGIGKTLGYLVPAISYAVTQQKQVAISVYTSHLVEQLFTEDLPKVEQLLGTKIAVAMVKGKRNYIDLTKVQTMLSYTEHSYDETLTLLQILVWLTETVTGDTSELNVSGGGQLVVDKLRKEQDSKPSQPFDFYQHALRCCKDARIIVTNHAMVLSHTEQAASVFAHVDGWVFDEAHQLIQAAMQREEQLFSYTYCKYIFGQIGTYDDEGTFKALYEATRQHERVSPFLLHEAERLFTRMITQFDQVTNALAQNAIQKFTAKEHKQTVFLQQTNLPSVYYQGVADAMISWLKRAETITAQFSNELVQLTAADQQILADWRYLLQQVHHISNQWQRIFNNRDDQTTAWLELDKRSVPSSLRIIQHPFNVANTIQASLANLGTCAKVFTSGTMTVPKQPTFITAQLGLTNETPVVQLHAPQSYYKGAQAFIVTDMPDIQQVPQHEYIEMVAYAITRTVKATEGRCFVLFTSQQMLRQTVELIQESELLHDYMLFAQGITSGSRMRILKSFQKFKRAVLFGTNSFWEGVDVPGDALAAVIVVRLPFSAPEAPLFKAQAARITAQGGNAFYELSLPEAILRFKQGFGRLIRSSQDKGALIVLDRRIETKTYGKAFIAALPSIPVHKVPLTDMVLQLENWYNKNDKSKR